LQGAVIGGIVGGVIGGIDGGLRAQQNDSNFWTGKSNWQEIKIGKASLGLSKQNVDFGDSKWEVKSEMKLKQFNQGDDTMCTFRCKESVDDYFGLKPDNSVWQKMAENNVVNDHYLSDYYKRDYNVKSFGANPGEHSVDWIIEQMKSNHVVHVSWMPDSSKPLAWHASLINKVEQNVKTLAYRLGLMDPANSRLFEFKLLKNIFSIWKK
jgi:hypothetical protein